VFGYNLGYSGVASAPLARFFDFFRHPEIFRSTTVLWIAAGAGALCLIRLRNRRGALGVGAMIVGSYLAICLPGRFWPHYYGLLLPWLVIAAGVLLAAVAELRRWGPTLSIVLALALLAGVVASQARYYLALAPDDVSRFRYGVSMPWARDIGQRVAAVTAPEDAIFVWGSEVGIYYYADRRCATRYTMNEPVAADRAGLEARQQLLMADLGAHHPRLILVSSSAAEPPFAELDRFIREGYVFIGADAGQGPALLPRVQVLADAARPLPAIDPATYWNWNDE
jgi:hypothetical protein